MTRHRGIFKPTHPEPYEISRSQIEKYVSCPACFWMNRVKGIKFPSIPGFLLNTATDTLLKKDFNKYRNIQKPHPFMERNGLGHLVPFKHDDFETWTVSLQLGLRTNFKPANFIVGGGLDDVWHNRATNELHIIDYKSTASKMNKEKTSLEMISLFGNYKSAYKRQMEIYQWILRRNGFIVSNIGYFVYVNGDQHFQNGMLESDKDEAAMKFRVQLIEYQGSSSWVEDTILEISKCLRRKECPEHAKEGFGPKGDKQCEYAELFYMMKANDIGLLQG